MGFPAIPGICREQDFFTMLRVMKSIKKPRCHTGSITEGRMFGYLFYTFSININFSSVIQFF